MLFVLINLMFSSNVLAQGDFYQLTQVDYFSLRAVEKKDFPRMPLWEEQERLPFAVRNLLNEPNEETARRYLDWNRERLVRVARAQEMIEAVVSSEKKP